MKQGYNLIAVIFILLIMIALVFTTLAFLSSTSVLSVRNANSQRAFYIASSGLENYLFELRQSDDWALPPPAMTKDFAGGSFSITTTNESKSSIVVLSTGRFTQEGTTYSRTIRITAQSGGLQALASEYIVYWTGGGNTSSNTILENNVYLGGSILVNNNMQLGLNNTISGDAYAAGEISGFTSGITGTIEAFYDMPDVAPTLETKYYDGQITIAATYPAGDKTYSNGETISGTTYVNGDIKIANNANITVTGSTTLVATGKFIVENFATVGDQLTVIAGDLINVKNDLTVGTIGVWYTSVGLEVGNNVIIGGTGDYEGSRFVTPGDIVIKNNSTIDGLFYASGKVEIGNNLEYNGMILTSYFTGAGENSTLHLAPETLDWNSLEEIIYNEEGGISLIHWSEVY